MNFSPSVSAISRAFIFGLALCCFGSLPASGQNIGGIQSFTTRPFVTGITPVIGSNGAVGGVSVDADGVVGRVEAKDSASLRDIRQRAQQPIENPVADQSALRMVSLARLDKALAKRIESNQQLSEEMFFLAGLRRVQYVFVVPERNDIVIAGPAGAIDTDTLRLDDLVDALRYGRHDNVSPITCSIEPTEDGLKRYAQLMSRRLTYSKRAVSAMEKALGPQQIILGGIAADSHFARVLVAADYMMKRLAMGFEASPIEGMPDYLDMLKKNRGPTRESSPRFWMTADYQPLLHSPDRLSWQLRGQGVKTMTEDSMLNDQGVRADVAEPNPVAQRWAETMTAKYEDLAARAPVFGQLRNCIDLAVLGALLANEGMLTVADCKLDVLVNESRLQGHRFPVPRSLPSRATMVKGRSGWIISVSGGVEINPWSIVERIESSRDLAPLHHRAANVDSNERWWW